MSDEIFFDGNRYISAGEAASQADLTRDYLARLCKERKILGRRIGKQWYVNQDSLRSFILEQSFDREKRRQHLAESRKREYSSGSAEVPKAVPVLSSRSTHVHDAFRAAIARMPAESAVHAARAIASTPIQAISLAKHGSVHPAVPFVDSVHKMFAGLIALLFVVGTYAFVDAQYARIAERSATFGDAIFSSMTHQLAAVSENPTATLSNIPNALATFARTLNRRVDSFVYGTMFPVRIAKTSRASSVAVRVVPRSAPGSSNDDVRGAIPGSGTSSVTRTANAGSSSSSAGRTIIERVVETQRIVSAAGGITEEYLNARLNQLDSKLSSQLYSVSAQSSSNTTQIQSNFAAVGDASRIERLDDITLADSTITGGSISGTSISATSLSASGATSLAGALTVNGTSSLATTTVTGDLTVTGSFTGGSVSFGATTLTGLTATNSTTTNATTTNLFANYASTTHATSTSLFSVLGTFTSSVVNALNAISATITNLTTTELVATNATTTNATSTNSYISNLSAVTASTTNLTFTTAVGGNATTTNLFSTTASSTNLFSANSTIGALSAGTLSLVSTLNVSGLSTFAGFLSTASSTIGDGTQAGGLTVNGGATTRGNAFFAGTVGVGAQSNVASAVVQIDSTTKGFLPPRLTTAQKNAILSPASGLTVFDTDLNKLNVWNGSVWKNVGSTEIGGEVTSGTNNSVLFVDAGSTGPVLQQDNSSFNYASSTHILTLANLSLTAGTSTSFFSTNASTTNSTSTTLYASAA